MKKMAIEKLDSPFLLSDGMIRQFLHHNTASAILLIRADFQSVRHTRTLGAKIEYQQFLGLMTDMKNTIAYTSAKE